MKQFTGLLIAASSLTLVDPAWSEEGGLKVGDSPPPFGLEKILQAPDGTKVEWVALKGKVVVLEFWATWCGPCIAAIPHLNELADKFKDEPVQFIAVTDEDEKVIGPFLKRKPIHAWIGLDTDKSMFKAYGIGGIPHTVLVDKKGKIAAITHPTYLTEAILKDALAGRKLNLAQVRGGGIHAGEVPFRDGENQGLPNLFQVVIRPSATNDDAGASMASASGNLTIARSSVLDVFGICYDVNPVRIMTNSAMPDGKFDFVIKTADKSGESARSGV
jgi:thiol-disulfide isomerase/thioredoxin